MGKANFFAYYLVVSRKMVIFAAVNKLLILLLKSILL